MYESKPRWGLAKIQRLLAHTKTDKDDNTVIPAKAYSALSTREKFTYCMMNGEVFDQNCDGMPGFVGEEKKIFAHAPGPWFEQDRWSPRQIAFLSGHRGTVLSLIRQTITTQHRSGTNLNKAIIDLHAWEMIPALVALYQRDHKDHDLLSVCMILMKDGNYRPFASSPMYNKLYGDPDASWKSFIDATPHNQRLLIQRAMAYYRSKRAS